MAEFLKQSMGQRGSGQQLVLELAGPAGAGKSTLSRALARKVGATSREIWGQPVLPLLGNGVRLLPRFGALWLHSRSLLWNETRHIVRLQTLQRTLVRSPNGNPLIFDEGPVFALAWLRGFGHVTFRQSPSDVWWQATICDWASLIDVVVAVDAPDRVLAERIRTRAHDHEVKGFSDGEIERWMARFRDALEWVLDEMAEHGGPLVVRLSSQDEHAEEMADRLLEELSGRVHAG
jgi:hypothetical protein